MLGILEALRETFTVYLAAGVMFSAASVWAAFKAMRADEPRQARERRR